MFGILSAECFLPKVVIMLDILSAELLLPQVVNYASHYASRMLTAAGSELWFTLCQQNLSKPSMFVRISWHH